jgi:Mn2+/Fe2+ NRAMP family transporter
MSGQLIFLIIIGLILGWILIGYLVIIIMDRKSGNTDMIDWIDRAPYGMSLVMVMFFPVYIVLYIKKNRKQKMNGNK